MNDTSTNLEKSNTVSEDSSFCPIDIEAAKSRVMGDMEFLKEMLMEFIEASPSYLESLTGAVKQTDSKRLSEIAHQLKGAASNLSLDQIAQRATKLLGIGREKKMEYAGEALSELEKAVMDFKEYFNSHF